MPYYELPNQNKLSGINTLAYMGTEASTPPQFVVEKRDPTINDYQGWRIGTIWLQQHTQRVWMLVDKQYLDPISGNRWPARWVMINGDEGNQYDTDNGTAYPRNGILNILGGVNMHTEALAPNQDTVTVNVVDHPVLAGGLTITPLGAPGVVTTDAAGLLNSTNGVNGQIIVARGAGPQWVDLVSADASVIFSESLDPLHPGAINMQAAGGGGGGSTKLEGDDALTVTPDILTGIVKVIGDDTIKTFRSALDTLTIGIEDSPHNGDIMIGGGAGVPTTWATLTSLGGSVTITNPGPNQINLEAAGIAALTALSADAGVAAPLAGVINIHGAGGLTTSAAGNVVTIDAGAPNLDGRVLISTAGGAATWRTLTAGANVTITEGNDGAGQIVISAAGGGAGGGVQQIDCDSGVAVNPPATNIIRLEGYHGTYNSDHVGHPYQNIYTSSPAGTPDMVYLRLTSTIQLPVTNAGGTAGVIMIGTRGFMHSYGTNNTFLGSDAGNRTMTVADSHNNVAIGYNAMNKIAHSRYCVGVGSGALGALVGEYQFNRGDRHTAIGYLALGQMTIVPESNIAIGYRAGYNIVNSGSNNIFIGNEGVAADSATIRLGTLGTHTNTFVAGAGGTPDQNANLLFIRKSTATNPGLLNSLLHPASSGKALKTTGIGYTWSTGAGTYLFNAYPQDTTNVTGDGTVYWLGAEAGKPLILVKNVGGGNYNLGSAGNAAYYEIPEKGTFLVAMHLRLSGLVPPFVIAPPPPPPAIYDPMVIAVERGGAIIKQWAHYPSLKYDGYTGFVSAFFSVMYEFNALDKVKWYIQMDYRPGESVGGTWPLTYIRQSKTIGIDTLSGDLQFSQVYITNLTDL